MGFENANDRPSAWSGASENNTWDLSIAAKASHFVTLQRPTPTGAESIDALLALFYKSDFTLPASGSPLVDAGKKLTGVSFNGSAPDLGGRERP